MDHHNPLLAAGGKKFITIGEIMLRLTPPNYDKIRVASMFEASYGGSEANIALALALTKAPAGEIEGRVREMAQRLGIEDCLDKYPYQMSGGQQQRCAAARAMVTRPDLVLADEPTGALDSRAAGLLLERLESLNRDLGATILMVTHDAFTASCCRRVIFLRDGQIFTQLRRQGDRRDFFRQIMDVVAQLGGEVQNVL